MNETTRFQYACGVDDHGRPTSAGSSLGMLHLSSPCCIRERRPENYCIDPGDRTLRIARDPDDRGRSERANGAHQLISPNIPEAQDRGPQLAEISQKGCGQGWLHYAERGRSTGSANR
jgi:hypothetical protein